MQSSLRMSRISTGSALCRWKMVPKLSGQVGMMGCGGSGILVYQSMIIVYGADRQLLQMFDRDMLLKQQLALRSIQNSQAKYDVDFYLRKVLRLQSDLAKCQDQLSAARVRLRKAEDFQIKHQLISKQLADLLNQNQHLHKENNQRKIDNDGLREKLELDLLRKNQMAKDISSLNNQIDLFKNKLHQLERRKDQEVIMTRTKAQLQFNQQLELFKLQTVAMRDQLQDQIARLKKLLSQKIAGQRQQSNKAVNFRAQNDDLLGRMTDFKNRAALDIEEVRANHQSLLLNLKIEMQNKYQNDLNSIRDAYQRQLRGQEMEMGKLRGIIEMKNRQAEQLIQLEKRNHGQHQNQSADLKAQIKMLELKVVEEKRKLEVQMFDLKDRLIKQSSQEISQLKNIHRAKEETLLIQIEELKRLLAERQHQLEQTLNSHALVRKDYEAMIQQRQRRINQLSQQLRLIEQNHGKQYNVLHESFKNIEHKQDKKSLDYQANIGFLDSQIKKMAIALQTKNKQILQLHEEISILKKQHDKQLREADSHWKNQRRERQKDRDADREERDRLQQNWRSKEKAWRAKTRQIQRQLQLSEQQRGRMRNMIEVMQVEQKRMADYVKETDLSLQNQRSKGNSNLIEKNSVLRNKQTQLQRIKNDLEAIKRTQVDQIKNSLQLEIQRRNDIIDRQRRDLQSQQHLIDDLNNKIRTYQSTIPAESRINQDRMVEAQRKLAAMQAQIGLSNNVLNVFKQAKQKWSLNK